MHHVRHWHCSCSFNKFFFYLYHFAQIVSQHHILLSYMSLVSIILFVKYDITLSSIFIIPMTNDGSHSTLFRQIYHKKL